MDESLSDPEREVSEAPEPIGNWHLPSQEIRSMDSEKFRDFVIDLHERVGRLYDLEMVRLHPDPEVPLTEEDMDHILNLENVD